MSDVTTHPLWTEQERLEAEMTSLGISRFKREVLEAQQEGVATKAGGTRNVLRSLINPTAVAIQEFIEAALAGKAGRRHTLVTFVKDTPADVLAYLTTKIVLDGMASEQKLTRVAVRLGRAVEVEQRLMAFMAVNKPLLKTVLEDLKSRTTNEEHMRKVVRHVMAEKGDGWQEWGDKICFLVGSKLVELLEEATNVIKIETRNEGAGKTVFVLRMSPSFRTWIAQLDDRLGLMSPEYLPCVVPPKDWDSTFGGGYYTEVGSSPLPLVKTHNKEHQDALKTADLSLVYRAVNAIQSTPWTVETRTLAVIKQIIDKKLDLPVLPPVEDEPIPARPADIPEKGTLTEDQLERLSEWRRRARDVYTANERTASRRLQVLKAVALAEQFAKYPAIYFPHQLDFRGRVYSVPQVLNPQGPDFSKGLLVFSEGAPLDTDRAQGWFMIHGANTFGNDKVPFDERIAWVQDNEMDILASAEDPLGHLWWTEADSPFCFLTWCFEYKDWYEHSLNPALSGGDTFLSRVPVALDGTCNGLQHYSAMLRDPVGGKAVNLVPTEKPQDIYGEVAKVVVQKLTEKVELLETVVPYCTTDQYQELQWARSWLGFGIDRKITKRAVMVLPYGGTQSSCREYVEQAVLEKIAAGAENPFGDNLRKASFWLAGVVWESIGEVVVAARAAMGWLMDTARVASHDGMSLTWTTPSGFPVVQAYPELGQLRIKTTIHGQVAQPRLTEEKDTLDKRRQANGVAPNFVHSMDAAALVLMVDLALDNGVTRFSVIHDSYGTTAGNTDMLAACTRTAFVSMYEDYDVLGDFRASITQGLTEKAAGKVSSPPMAGGLDLAQVMESPFFFA